MPQPPGVPWSPRLLRGHLIAAHGALVAALLWLAVRAEALVATALHPEVLAAVHLVTLGCLVTAALGAFHVVLPLTMRTVAPAAVWDWTLLALVQVVAAGVAAHMWLQTFGGVYWSAALLAVALLAHYVRLGRALARAAAPRAMQLGCALAWSNLLAAAALGGGIAWHRRSPWLHDWLAAVVAHAHLALGGFAGTLLAAVGLRLLPMLLPAAPPPPAAAYAAVLGLGAGGLACGLGALAPGWLEVGRGGLLLGALGWAAGWLHMLRHRRPTPSQLPRWLPSHLWLLSGLLAGIAAVGIGVACWRQWLGPAAWSLYGSLLLGCLVAFVVGAGQRLVPMAERLHSGHGDAHRLRGRRLQWFAAWAWATGLPALAAGLWAAAPGAVRAATLVLAAATAAAAVPLLLPRVRPGGLVSSARP